MKVILVAWVLVCAIATSATALEFKKQTKDGKDIFLVTGVFEPGCASSLARTIDRAGHIDEVWLSSPGGSVNDGMAVGRKIRTLQLATRIPNGANCDSICAFAFLGGVVRDIDPGGKYGVHMFSGWCDVERKERIYLGIKSALGKVGCNKSTAAGLAEVIVDIGREEEQQSAITARKMADYLMEMEVSLRLLVPNFETGVACGPTNRLSREELVSYNVINAAR